MIIVCQSLGSRPILVLELSLLCPVSLEQPPLSVQSVSSFSSFKIYLKTHLFDLAFLPIDTVTAHGLLMLQNCFLDFAVEH